MANLRFPAASTPDLVNGLPFEVLDHIFQDCLALDAPSYDSEWNIQCLFPYNASNVCRRWWQILSDQPRYWKYVFIDIARDPAPFLDVITKFHAGYTTKAVVVFSTIRNQETGLVPEYYTAELENARSGQIFKRILPIVPFCTHIKFNLIYQSSLPSVADICRRDTTSLTQLSLMCTVHDRDGAPFSDDDLDIVYRGEGEDSDSDTDSDSDDYDESGNFHSKEPQDNTNSRRSPSQISIDTVTQDAPMSSLTHVHDEGNRSPSPASDVAMETSNLSALTHLHLTGIGFCDMFELGKTWQWKAFPPGNDKLDLHITHLRIGPYLHNPFSRFRKLNSLTQFTSYIASMPCKVSFSNITFEAPVLVDPAEFDEYMDHQGRAREYIEFPSLTFIHCHQDFIAGFLRYMWSGDTRFEVDSPLITFDDCFIPEPDGPREFKLEYESEDLPSHLILKNIPLGEDEEEDDEDNGSIVGDERGNSSVANALRWFPYADYIRMENCHGLSHSCLMAIGRDFYMPPLRGLELHNCSGFTSATIREIVERYQYHATLRDDPNVQMVSVKVAGDIPKMNREDEIWLCQGGAGRTIFLWDA